MKGVAAFFRPIGHSSSKGANSKSNGCSSQASLSNKAKNGRSRSLSPRGSPPRVAKRHALYSVGPFLRTTSGSQTMASAPGIMNLRHSHLCPHCEKDFPNLSSLNKHLTSHSQDRPHECIVCNKRFKRFDHLTSHMLTHRGEKPFQCPLEMCQKRYSDQRSLKRHMDKNHSTYDAGHDLTLSHQKWSSSTTEEDYDCRGVSRSTSSRNSPEEGWQDGHRQGPGREGRYPPQQGSDWGPGHRGWEGQQRPAEYLPPGKEERGMERGEQRTVPRRAATPVEATRSHDKQRDRERRAEKEGPCERVGPEYQAVVPTLGDSSPLAADCQRELVWAPSAVAEDKQVDDFVKFAGSMAVFGGGWMPEYALSVLHRHGGHIKTALGLLLMPSKKSRRMERDSVVHWSPVERAAFEEGFRELGKSFHNFNRYVHTKTTAQIIQYYYKWKRQEPDKYHQYAASHKAQPRLPPMAALALPEPEACRQGRQGNLEEPRSSPQTATCKPALVRASSSRHTHTPTHSKYRSTSTRVSSRPVTSAAA